MRLMKKGLLALLGTLCLNSAALADTSSSTFMVSATVIATCTVSASNITFGNITPTASGTQNATGTVTSTCSNGTPYVLSFSSGSSSDYVNRTMKPASVSTEVLKYNLYTTNAKSTVLGDGTSSTGTLSGTGSGSAQNTTIYASMPLNQYVTPGNWTDTITVTITY